MTVPFLTQYELMRVAKMPGKTQLTLGALRFRLYLCALPYLRLGVLDELKVILMRLKAILLDE
jgi:hypothetical protein